MTRGVPMYLYAAQWQHNADKRTQRVVRTLRDRAQAAQVAIAQSGSLPLTVVTRMEQFWEEMSAKWQAQRIAAEKEKRRQRMRNRRSRQKARRKQHKRQTRKLDAADLAAGIVDTAQLSQTERAELTAERERKQQKQQNLQSQLSSLAQTMSALQGLPIQPVSSAAIAVDMPSTAVAPPPPPVAAEPSAESSVEPSAVPVPVPPLPQAIVDDEPNEKPNAPPAGGLMAAIRSGAGRRRLRSVDLSQKRDALVDAPTAAAGEAGASADADASSIVINGRQRRLSTVAANGGSLLEQIHSVRRKSLRATVHDRSPGGTPAMRKDRHLDMDPLAVALRQKFEKARTPQKLRKHSDASDHEDDDDWQ